MSTLTDEDKRDYDRAFAVIQDACDKLNDKGIGPGLASVVLVRMSALICRQIGVSNEDFAEFSGQHYKMIVNACDEAIAEEEAEQGVLN